MAVGFDSFAKKTNSGSSVSSLAVPVTIATGNILVVIVGFESTTNSVSSISGAATWGGSAIATFTGFYKWEVWAGTSPSTGTVTINFTATSLDAIAYVWSFSGAATPVSGGWVHATGIGNAGNQVAVTTVNGDGAAAASMDGTSLTAVSGCTTTLETGTPFALDNTNAAAHCLATGASTSFVFNSTGSSDTVGIDVPQSGATPITGSESDAAGILESSASQIIVASAEAFRALRRRVRRPIWALGRGGLWLPTRPGSLWRPKPA
jgi:hypothetical protein